MSYFAYLLKNVPSTGNPVVASTLSELARKEAIRDLTDNGIARRLMRYPGGIAETRGGDSLIPIDHPYSGRRLPAETWNEGVGFAQEFGRAAPPSDTISMTAFFSFIDKGMKAGLFDDTQVMSWISQNNILSGNDADVAAIAEHIGKLRRPEATDEKFDAFLNEHGKFLGASVQANAQRYIDESVAIMFRNKGLPVRNAGRETVIYPKSSFDMAEFAIEALKTVEPNKKTFLVAAPYFEPMGLVPEIAGFDVKIIPTDDTDHVLTASKLERALEEAGGAKNVAGLLMVTPNHINQKTIPVEELKELGKVIVKNRLRVVSDELQNLNPDGNVAREPSLAGLTVEVDGKPHAMYQNVFTSDGMSKRYNVVPSQAGMKASFGASGDTEWVNAIKEKIAEQNKERSDLGASSPSQFNLLVAAHVLRHTPDTYFTDNAEMFRRVTQEVEGLLHAIRARHQLAPDDLKLTSAPGHTYLKFLEISPELVKKVGIENAEQLQEYMMSYAGVMGHQEMGSGSQKIGVRFNPHRMLTTGSGREAARLLWDALDRVGQMLENIHEDKAPQYSDVKKRVDIALNQHFNDQLKGASTNAKVSDITEHAAYARRK